jgi:hypothetical protein
MADNEFIIPCLCDDSAFITITDVDPDCPPIGDLSEVVYLLLSDTSQAVPPVPADWTLPADWAAVIDNAVNDGTKIKKLIGVGRVESGEPTTRLMPAHKTIYGETTYTLTFRLKSPDQTLYDFLQKLENCPSLPNFWFVTVGGYMFGAPEGIVSASMRPVFALAEGEDSYEEYDIIINWKSRTRPLRIASPV